MVQCHTPSVTCVYKCIICNMYKLGTVCVCGYACVCMYVCKQDAKVEICVNVENQCGPFSLSL